MSDINANIVISPIDLGVTVNTNQLTFTPDATSLNFYTGGISTTANGLNANVANVHIYDGVNGYVLQTDGAGNLSWTAQTGNGGGNGTPGGANTQVQYNDAGSFGGNVGFTFNEVTGNLNVPGNIIATTVIGNVSNANFSTYSGIASSANLVAGANVTGTVANATYANISGVAYSVAGANVSGAVAYATTANSVAGANVSGSVANATYANISGVAYSVAGANVSGAVAFATTANSVAGANVSGQVANALISGTVYTNAQPNITSVGTLTSLSVTGNISSGNANLGNLAIANFFSGNGSLLTGINGANVSNVANANYANFAGTVVNTAQPNITSVGRLTDLFVTNTKIHLGFQAGYIGGGNASTQSANAIAIGTNAGNTTQGANAVAIGINAGSNNQAVSAVAIGYGAAQSGQGSYATAVGVSAGNFNQGSRATGVGIGAGSDTQGANATAVGSFAGSLDQGIRSVAIGTYAGYTNQGTHAIAIGANAAYSNQHISSIMLNATGANLDTTQANSFFVKPIRQVTGNVDFTVTLKYNPTTGEIGYV